jgi:hypothetical protein
MLFYEHPHLLVFAFHGLATSIKSSLKHDEQIWLTYQLSLDILNFLIKHLIMCMQAHFDVDQTADESLTSLMLLRVLSIDGALQRLWRVELVHLLLVLLLRVYSIRVVELCILHRLRRISHLLHGHAGPHLLAHAIAHRLLATPGAYWLVYRGALLHHRGQILQQVNNIALL